MCLRVEKSLKKKKSMCLSHIHVSASADVVRENFSSRQILSGKAENKLSLGKLILADAA